MYWYRWFGTKAVCTDMLAFSTMLFQMLRSGLQVIGLRNVFAAGDVTNVAEEKTAFFAELAGLVAAENVARLDKGRELKAYSSKRDKQY